MEIQFYLNEKPVQQGFFKKFSSCCDTWIQFIRQNEPALNYIAGTLKLVYMPCNNVVKAIYDKDIRLVKWMDEEIISLHSAFTPKRDHILERI